MSDHTLRNRHLHNYIISLQNKNRQFVPKQKMTKYKFVMFRKMFLTNYTHTSVCEVTKARVFVNYYMSYVI